MSVWLFLGVAAAGGIGAALRMLIDGLVNSTLQGSYPWGTLLINTTGSFLLGLLTGLGCGLPIPEPIIIMTGTGLLGGYTTFSTASIEAIRLIQDHRPVAALIHSLGMLLAASAAAGLGLWLGSLT
ncbi:fluoride efflux transporter FluC [Arthrobacter pigmenti]